MQDYDRGVLVGRRSYGKGLVQQTRPLAYNSQLKVTTGKYYIPSGRCIQAIDYSHRNPDGSLNKIADSLKSAFTTQLGRPVFDGGGVNPDIPVDEQEYAPITYALMSSDLIFDFATEYYFTHSEIPSAKEFSISDEDYAVFKEWLNSKNLNYSTDIEEEVELLMASAKDEEYFPAIKDQLIALQRATLHSKEDDLTRYDAQIKQLLEQEIAGRYYFQSGMVETGFDNDPDILAAVKVLSDKDGYSQILK
jgi:carboxyl-terminal processing protease